MHVISVYAPQAEYSSNEKDKFWMDLGNFISTIYENMSILRGVDLDGHVCWKRDV